METKIPLTKEQAIDAMFVQLELKKAEVALGKKPVYFISNPFRYSEGMSNQIDISTAREERKLIEVVAFLKERAKAYGEAAAELGCESKFTWLGFTPEEWTADCQMRVNVLQIDKKVKELAALEIRINKVVPADIREAREIVALQKELGI